MDTLSPVIDNLKEYEMPIGGEGFQISVLRSPEGRVVSRWTFTEEERRAIAEGADLFLTIHTFNHQFQPVRLDVGSPDPGCTVEGFKRDMRLDDQAELLLLVNEANKAAVVANAARQALEEKQKEVFAPLEPSKIALVH